MNLPFNKQRKYSIKNKSGAAIATFTSFISIDYITESQVAEYPIEKGNFFSYNKIKTPKDITATVAMQGKEYDLQRTATDLEKLVDDTEILSIETPVGTIKSLTLYSMTYSLRREDGVGMVIFELKLKEIKELSGKVSNISLGQAFSGSNVSRVDSGKVQGQEVKEQSVLNKLFGKVF